jgi:hypothetical protein
MTNTYPLQMRKLTKPVVFLSVLMAMNSGLLAKEIAGKTIITRGIVQATDSIPGLQRILKRRSPIYGTDVVTTELDSKAQLRMTDGGMIALKENSELLISSYEFNAVDQTGSVVMELVKGGLRSVTGAIKSEKGNYQLKTPIGSIGIRGTHYEIELIVGELFIAVWDGAIDISVEVGGQEQEIVLGEDEDYAYAKIDESGEVTELLEPPENFSAGHSSDPKDAEETKETKKTEETETTKTAEKTDETKATEATGEESDAAGQKTETAGEETDVAGQQTESTGEETDVAGQQTETTGEESDAAEQQIVAAGEETDVAGQQTESTGVESDVAEQQIVAAGEETDIAGPQIQVEDEEILVFQEEQSSTPNQEQQVQEVVIVVEPIEEETDFITQDIAATELALTPEEELSELIAARTGIFVYDQVSNLVFDTDTDTEAGSNFTASMSINFDTSEISNGSLSFDDADGVEWFAAFNGAINGTGLDLGVNFASHGNELADGTIDSVFTQGVDELLNVFELFEVDNAEITTNGRFNLSH